MELFGSVEGSNRVKVVLKWVHMVDVSGAAKSRVTKWEHMKSMR